MERKMKEIPNFKFAIREDLQDTGALFVPTRGTPQSTGWDVKAAFKDRQSINVSAGQHVKIPLGFRTFAPEGWWYELKPRSSTFAKKNLHALYGTIDEDYEGELIFACQYIPDLVIQSFGDDSYSSIMRVKRDLELITINFGDAIGQIIPVKRLDMNTEVISNEEYKKLCQTRSGSRGAGGFGSTDKKDSK
jgi:dUTPase